MNKRRRPRYAQRSSDGHSRRLFHALSDLYQLLRTPRPIDELLQAILDTALAYVPGAQRGSLLVADGNCLGYRAVSGYDLEQLRPVSFPIDLVRDIVLSGVRSRQIEDFTQWDADYLGDDEYRILIEHGALNEIRRSLVTAILVGGKLYGTLVLDNLHSHAPFPSDAEALALLFADQAGTLIEQALLIEQLRQTNTMLIEAEKMASLGRFIASIAHEINNPLTAVLGYADFLAASDLDPQAQSLLRQLRAGAERVRTIVRNLQIFARQQKSGATRVDLNLLIEQTLTLKRRDLALDQITVETEFAELPSTWGDAGQLSQVLLNLLVNAQYALRQQALPRKLVVRTTLKQEREGDPWLLLVVADNGPGIAPDIQPRIFEPFFSTKPAGEGTGLGLSICQAIIGAHGGTLAVRAAPAQGATFLVELPLRVAPAEPAAEPVATPASAPRGARILLIDDDPAVVDVVRAALERENSLTVAGNGHEALRIARVATFDLVLCDLRMPGMDGPELFRQLGVIYPRLAERLLFISGDTSSLATRSFLEQTGRPLLGKPFTPAELYAAIAALAP